MDAPKCKICGNRHYNLCVVPARQSEKVTVSPPLLPPVPTALPDPVEASGFDRTGYQRNYMRQRRAEEQPVYALYAIVRAKQPDIVKLGMTRRWSSRRSQYGRAKDYAVYFLDKPDHGHIDLPMLEVSSLIHMNMLPCMGREYYNATIQQAMAAIEHVLSMAQVTYTLERYSPESAARNTKPACPNPECPKKEHPKQDRRAYWRDYKQRKRQAQRDAAPPAPPREPTDRNAYMREYMRRRRAMQST